jgi:guanine deaminase
MAAGTGTPGTAADQRFLRQAIDLAVGSARGPGGPFGALVVRGGEVVGEGTNRVTATCDPTAHAEVVAIRDACSRLGTFELSGCELYASSEPCPLCYAAAMWARVDRVVHAATRADAAAAGFDDAEHYDELARPPRSRRVALHHVPVDGADAPFAAWAANPDKVRY